MIYKIEIVTFQKINYNEGINAGALFMFISEGRRKDKTKKRMKYSLKFFFSQKSSLKLMLITSLFLLVNFTIIE